MKKTTGLSPGPVVLCAKLSLWSPLTLDEYEPRAASSPFDLWHGHHPLLK